jgi:hypothetical protein
MMVVDLEEEAVKLADRMVEILSEATSAVARQQVIEILMVGHAVRMTGPREPAIVIDGMAKHAKQLMEAMVRQAEMLHP